jgi:hypothetical protein
VTVDKVKKLWAEFNRPVKSPATTPAKPTPAAGAGAGASGEGSAGGGSIAADLAAAEAARNTAEAAAKKLHEMIDVVDNLFFPAEGEGADPEELRDAEADSQFQALWGAYNACEKVSGSSYAAAKAAVEAYKLMKKIAAEWSGSFEVVREFAGARTTVRVSVSTLQSGRFSQRARCEKGDRLHGWETSS